jgi:hypothetical protein
MGEYTDYPTDYAEVSSNLPSGQQSPAPYATTTIIGNSKNRVAANEANRFNMFYTAKEIYPPTTNVVGGVPNQNSSNYNRSINSDSYCTSNSNNRATNVVENRSTANNNKSNTTIPTNKFNHHRNGNSKIGSNKRNRLKLMTPQNFRINFGNNEDGRCSEQLYVKVGEMNQNQLLQHTPKSQNGSQNWSQQNFNIYENQLHNLGSKSSSSSANDSEKELIYSGDRSVISYTSSKDFPDDA